MVRWWWPGNAVDDAEIARQIGLLDAAGFGGAEIQPFNLGPLDLTPEQRARLNTYAEPSFFAHVRAAAMAAQVRSPVRGSFGLDQRFQRLKASAGSEGPPASRPGRG